MSIPCLDKLKSMKENIWSPRILFRGGGMGGGHFKVCDEQFVFATKIVVNSP
jgi:hypothetical protein